jgi:drug/metabolite transporter (DMT)-like permease
MFIGEMGCWLVVGVFSLYNKFVSRRGPEYQRIDGDEGLNEADAQSLHSNAPLNPAAKALAVDEEGRVHLRGWRLLLLSLPAICDICGTTLMNVGLLFTVASIYQMTRGMLVLWVGLFSVIFLKKRLHIHEWFALFTVVVGVCLVGVAGALHGDEKAAAVVSAVKETAVLVARRAQSPDALRTIVGVLLIAGAQIFTATQFVLEEWILERYALEPIKVVGWEGIFGFLVTMFGMIVLHLAIGRTPSGRNGYFDAVEGIRQMTHYKAVAISSVLIMISIG